MLGQCGIILRDRVVLTPKWDEYYTGFSDLLKSLGIEDNYINPSSSFVMVELEPPGGNRAIDFSMWVYSEDQEVVPDWYVANPKRYEMEFRAAVKEHLKDKFVVLCGYAWTPIKSDDVGTYYLLDGVVETSMFGKTNNYAESFIREKLAYGDLVERLKKDLGNWLVPITSNLLSLDGLDDYGIIDGDFIAIPTLDLYRVCRKRIPQIDKWWWLATPDSTPSNTSGIGASDIRYVDSSGHVDRRGGSGDGGVRPFFILKSPGIIGRG